MKYRVTLYQETYSEIEVEAETREEAEELVMSGEFEDDQIVDVTTKCSEIIN